MSKEITLKDDEVVIRVEDLEAMVTANETQKEEFRALYIGAVKVLACIGLAENGRVKANVFEEGGNALPEILKGAGSILSTVMQAQVPVIGKKAEAKLIEQFSFFAELAPLFVKYQDEFAPTNNNG